MTTASPGPHGGEDTCDFIGHALAAVARGPWRGLAGRGAVPPVRLTRGIRVRCARVAGVPGCLGATNAVRR